MALSDIILSAGKLIVARSASTLQINANGKALNFGTVQAVNDLCDVTTVGSSIWFDVDKSTPFMIISGTTFYILDETDIISGETYIP